MKKRISLYAAAVIGIFSLQSCVSNYVVSTPTTYQNNKTQFASITPNTNADFASIKNELTVKDEAQNSYNVEVVKATDLKKMAALEAELKKNLTIDGILSEANSYLGTRYRMGGMTRSGIDCSAFVLSVFNQAAGIQLPRVAAAQAHEGERVERSQLEKGDLLFFHTKGSRVSHVGIVHEVTPEGEIKFIHASSSKGVTVSSLNEKYWAGKYRFAKRILKHNEEVN